MMAILASASILALLALSIVVYGARRGMHQCGYHSAAKQRIPSSCLSCTRQPILASE